MRCQDRRYRLRNAAAALALAAAGPMILPPGFADAAQAVNGAGLCDRLVAVARQVPAKAWAKGDKALAPALTLQQMAAKPTPFEARLAALPAIKDAIGADERSVEAVQRLPGTDIYMAESIQGTLDCQTSAFFEARPGAAPRMIAPPDMPQEGELCWTRSGDLGAAFGQPAYVEHGAKTDHALDEDIRIIPWTGAGWGQACTLMLRFRPSYTATQAFCGDADACRALKGAAPAIAAAHDAQEKPGVDDAAFRFGPTPTPEAQAAVTQAAKARGSTDTPAFPTIGGLPENQSPGFSYNGFAYLPLQLAGRWYVGAVGREGVGWRQSPTTLIAVYAGQGGALKPVASVEVELTNGGLEQVLAQSFRLSRDPRPRP